MSTGAAGRAVARISSTVLDVVRPKPEPEDATSPAILEFQWPSTAIINAPIPRAARGIAWTITVRHASARTMTESRLRPTAAATHSQRTDANASATLPQFGPWSTKDGTPHVQPPVELLQQMVTVRLHLDDCDEANGALRVLPVGLVSSVSSPSLSRFPVGQCFDWTTK